MALQSVRTSEEQKIENNDKIGEPDGGTCEVDVIAADANEDTTNDVSGDHDAHRDTSTVEAVGKVPEDDKAAVLVEEETGLDANNAHVIFHHGNRNVQAVISGAGEGNFRCCPTCGFKRKAYGEEDALPQYTKRARNEFPTRIMWESDIAYAFRILGHLREAKSITKSQETRCRHVMTQDVSKGLVNALMEYAVYRNNDKVVDSVEVVAPRPPPFMTYVCSIIMEKIERLTPDTVTSKLLKGAGYTVAVFGAAAFLRVKELL